MPTWNTIDKEIDATEGPEAADIIRQKYLKKLHQITGRITIAYYSGWLQRAQSHPALSIGDHDLNGFMATVHGMDKESGLDLILHTPGGDIESTRAIVNYLHQKFDRNIRVIVPQIAMSAGTMIACASAFILMGKQSSLGPMDPQLSGFPALGVMKTYDKAVEEMSKSPAHLAIWQTLFSRIPFTFITDCQRAVENTKNMVKEWLRTGMLSDSDYPPTEAEKVVNLLMDYDNLTSHAHHFSAESCRSFGLRILTLEDDQELQDAVLSVHHAYMATFTRTSVLKIIENHSNQRWTISQN